MQRVIDYLTAAGSRRRRSSNPERSPGRSPVSRESGERKSHYNGAVNRARFVVSWRSPRRRNKPNANTDGKEDDATSVEEEEEEREGFPPATATATGHGLPN